jgi:hypothetical protein
MIADLDYGLLPDESEDHFLGLEQAGWSAPTRC